MRGAFDLPSILTGVLVVSVMALGVMAVVFGFIPFSQDKAAGQDLAAVTTAQGVSKVKSGRYMSLGSLRNAGYITPGETLAVATDPAGTCFVSVSRSHSGQTYIATDQSPTPVKLVGTPATGCVPPTKVTELAGRAGGPGPAPVMTTVWDTRLDPACSTITLPLNGAINATINWGDGTPAQAVTSDLPSHDYATAGIKTIRIDGTFSSWVGTDWPLWSNHCITEVTEWGETGTTDVEAGFYDTINLTDVARIPWTATSWLYLFLYAENLGDLSDLDTSRVTDMRMLFGGSTFNGDISMWDTSRVTNMASMFDGAVSFNQPIGNWDVSQVTDISGMFTDTSAFNQPLNGWDTSSVTTMEQTFSYATAFKGSIGTWDTSNVTDMSGMFVGAPVFNSPIGTWDTSKVTTLSYMFQSAPAFNQPIGKWNTSKVNEMVSMFYDAKSFNQNINAWNTSGVTHEMGFIYLFYGATSYNQPMDHWDVSKTLYLPSMFEGASSFNQDLSGWNTSNILFGNNFSTGSALTPAHLPPGASSW